MAGSDGGLSQYFMLEVVGGDLLYASEAAAGGRGQFGETLGQNDNEISTLNDQVSRALIESKPDMHSGHKRMNF